MKRRKAQLELDEERPEERHISRLGGTEIWYYTPNPPRWHFEHNEHPCPTCCSMKTTLIVVDDGRRWGWCNACQGSMEKGLNPPNPRRNPGPTNNQSSAAGARQLELLT